jgi:glycosyltransferase involved in cell wall biosynthesis
MRIAFDHQIFGWQEYGGISRYAFELASALHGGGGDEVAIFCPLYVNRYLEHAPRGLLRGGRRVPPFPYSGRIYRELNRWLAWPAVRSFRPDIVHETYYSGRSSRVRGARHVLTVYDMIHERFPENFSPADPTRREKAEAVKRADHVICISEQTRADLVDILRVPVEKTSVVHLGFALTSSAGQRPAGQKPPLEDPYVLFVGSRRGYKNFGKLLEAYARSPAVHGKVRLLCLGGGAFRPEELDAISRTGLDPSKVTQMAGDDDVLANCYRHARAFIYPSRYEGFGIPPLEAMNFDCPVACSNMSSIPEVVGDAAEMFDPDSVEDMERALERVVNDEGRRLALIALGRERLGKFSWAACAKETLGVYRGLLN